MEEKAMTGLFDRATGKEIIAARRLARGKLEVTLYRHFEEAFESEAGAAAKEYAGAAREEKERLLRNLMMSGSYEAALFQAKAGETYADFAVRVFAEAWRGYPGLALGLARIEGEMAARWQAEEDLKAQVEAITLRVFLSPATAAAIEAYERKYADMPEEEAERRIREFEAQLQRRSA